MDDKPQNFLNTNLLEQAGIGPIVMPEPPKKKKWPFVVGGVAAVLLIGLGLVAVLVGPEKATEETTTLSFGNTVTDVESIVELAKDNQTQTIKEKHVDNFSPLKQIENNGIMFSAFVGDDVVWSGCSEPEQDKQDGGQSVEANGDVYNIIYMNISCPTTTGGSKTISFDMRRLLGSTDQWKLFFVVLKDQTNA